MIRPVRMTIAVRGLVERLEGRKASVLEPYQTDYRDAIDELHELSGRVDHLTRLIEDEERFLLACARMAEKRHYAGGDKEHLAGAVSDMRVSAARLRDGIDDLVPQS